MPEVEEQFPHSPPAVLTVGDLTQQVLFTPDDLPIVFSGAREPPTATIVTPSRRG
ncbi:hypothetical protein GCM10012275_42470 [Longimycelium tulufanense]|uniref:Uncharacterized protein n=1 Tax=Longimycelium tulufanense TaxID=907463 RepID=A0A8J3CAY9_9PSEU|nr:hypothetical protein [Longimycelium tulufanense]GGM67381.1 hypothetical protein GCM10012275_42470 [Longimycelium tulufanense]